jgi:hypothetical protein
MAPLQKKLWDGPKSHSYRSSMTESEVGEVVAPELDQELFDLTIGRLDRVLSLIVNWGRTVKREESLLDLPNRQTLKHHAEDMIAAGQKILRDLGEEVEGTPQPEKKPKFRPTDDSDIPF